MINEEQSSIYDIALDIVTKILSHEIERTMAIEADFAEKRMASLSSIFSYSPIIFFTQGINDVIEEVDVQPVESQNYLRNFITGTALRLRTGLNTSDIKGWELLTQELVSTLNAISEQEDGFLPTDYRKRIRSNTVDDINVVTMYLLAQAYQYIISNVGIAKHASESKRTN